MLRRAPSENGWSLRVTIRSVNHRFLDLHLRVPEGFEPLEPRIRQIIRERVRRGHLDVTVHYELAGTCGGRRESGSRGGVSEGC